MGGDCRWRREERGRGGVDVGGSEGSIRASGQAGGEGRGEGLRKLTWGEGISG